MPARASDPVIDGCSYHVGAGNWTQDSGRAANALNHWATFIAPVISFLYVWIFISKYHLLMTLFFKAIFLELLSKMRSLLLFGLITHFLCFTHMMTDITTLLLCWWFHWAFTLFSKWPYQQFKICSSMSILYSSIF